MFWQRAHETICSMAGRALAKILSLTPRTAEASSVPEPFGKPGGPGLWHHKEMQLPPYIQHVAHELVKSGHDESKAIEMAVGIVKNWAHGHNGKHKVHPDVQAAAAKNIAKWEELKAKAHSETAAKDTKKVAATMALAAPANQPSGRLQHTPAQTVSAGPPLPKGVKPPKPQDLNKLASDIESDASGSPHSTAAVKHLQAAAMVMETGDHAGALRMLRSAQTDVSALIGERQDDARDTMKHLARTGYGGKVPPAELSSMRSQMVGHLAKVGNARKHSVRIAKHIDAIRRSRPYGVHGEAPAH